MGANSHNAFRGRLCRIEDSAQKPPSEWSKTLVNLACNGALTLMPYTPPVGDRPNDTVGAWKWPDYPPKTTPSLTLRCPKGSNLPLETTGYCLVLMKQLTQVKQYMQRKRPDTRVNYGFTLQDTTLTPDHEEIERVCRFFSRQLLTQRYLPIGAYRSLLKLFAPSLSQRDREIMAELPNWGIGVDLYRARAASNLEKSLEQALIKVEKGDEVTASQPVDAQSVRINAHELESRFDEYDQIVRQVAFDFVKAWKPDVELSMEEAHLPRSITDQLDALPKSPAWEVDVEA